MLESCRDDLLQKVSKRVELVSGDGDVKGVDLFQAVALVNGAPGHIEHVAGLEDCVKSWLAYLFLSEVP